LIQSSWGSTELLHKHSIQSPWGDSYILDRNLFNRQLLDAATDHGACHFQGRFVSADRNDNVWCIEYKDKAGARQQTFYNFLVDATGRLAVVSRSLGGSLVNRDQLVAVIGFVRSTSTSSLTKAATIESCPDGWFYSTPVHQKNCVVNFYTSPDQIRAQQITMEQFLIKKIQESTFTSEKLLVNSEFEIESVQVRSARPQRIDKPYGDGWIAVGDAAASYDPMAADGICRALESGIMAGHTIEHLFAEDRASLNRYVAKMKSDYETHLNRRNHLYAAEQRWPSSKFWRRRITSRITNTKSKKEGTQDAATI
jgi:flavin-dependent dehydrogenase